MDRNASHQIYYCCRLWNTRLSWWGTWWDAWTPSLTSGQDWWWWWMGWTVVSSPRFSQFSTPSTCSSLTRGRPSSYSWPLTHTLSQRHAFHFDSFAHFSRMLSKSLTENPEPRVSMFLVRDEPLENFCKFNYHRFWNSNSKQDEPENWKHVVYVYKEIPFTVNDLPK